MLGIIIRKAEIKDARAIVLAAREIAAIPGYFCSQPDEINEQTVIETINTLEDAQKGIYLVAEIEGNIIGHAFLQPLHLKSISHVAQLTIAVHQGSQEKGIGTALMKQLIEWAKYSKSIEKIELNVRATNKRAIALYKKMGFAEEGRLKKRLKINQDVYIDDILMALHVKV